MASIHANADTLAANAATFPHVVLCFIPPRSTSYLQPCDVAVFRSFKSCIQAQASATLACSVIDGSFEGLAMNKEWRRQSSAEWAARATMDLCAGNKVWSTGFRQSRAQSDAEFRQALEESNELHAKGALFARQIEPEPTPADPVDWAMAEASDDEDDAPMPDAPLPHLGCPAWSGASHCAWYMVPDRVDVSKKCQRLSLLSHVSVVSCVLARTRVSTF